MNERDKEHFLHKVIASSAFLFALSVLPVANFFLGPDQLGSVSSGPQSVDLRSQLTLPHQTTVIRGNVPALQTQQGCQDQKQQKVDDLDRYYTGVSIAWHNKYLQDIAPYEQAGLDPASSPQLTDINKKYNDYLDRAKREVESQKAAVLSSPCPAG